MRPRLSRRDDRPRRGGRPRPVPRLPPGARSTRSSCSTPDRKDRTAAVALGPRRARVPRRVGRRLRRRPPQTPPSAAPGASGCSGSMPTRSSSWSPRGSAPSWTPGRTATSWRSRTPVHDRPGTEGERFVHTTLRLFRRGEGGRAWRGRVHEQVVGLAGPCRRVEGPFLRHHGYRPSIMAAKDKAARTIAPPGNVAWRTSRTTPSSASTSPTPSSSRAVPRRPTRTPWRRPTGCPTTRPYGALAWHLRLRAASDTLLDAELADAAGWGGLFRGVRADPGPRPARRRGGRAPSPADPRARPRPGPRARRATPGIATHKARVARAPGAAPAGPRRGGARRPRSRPAPPTPASARCAVFAPRRARRMGLPHAEDLRLAWEAAPDEMGLWAAWTGACEARGRPRPPSSPPTPALAARQTPSTGLLVNWGPRPRGDGTGRPGAGPLRRGGPPRPPTIRTPASTSPTPTVAGASGRRPAHLYETALRLRPDDPPGLVHPSGTPTRTSATPTPPGAPTTDASNSSLPTDPPRTIARSWPASPGPPRSLQRMTQS